MSPLSRARRPLRLTPEIVPVADVDTSAVDIEAGAPEADVSAEKVDVVDLDVAAAIEAGAPTAEAAAEIAAAVDRETAADIAAGAPTVGVSTEIEGVGYAETSAAIGAGPPAAKAFPQIVAAPTNVARVRFGAGAWVPRPEPPRAVMPLIVTVRDWDTTTLVTNLAKHVAANLDWAELYETVVPLDAVPIESATATALAGRVGALVLSIDFNQPAPLYPEFGESDVPEQADVRVLAEQMVSDRSADRGMLLYRRREFMILVAGINGMVG